MIVNGRSRYTELATIVYDHSEATVEDQILNQSSMSPSSLSSGNLSSSIHGHLKISLSEMSLEMSPKASSVKESTFNATDNLTRGMIRVLCSMCWAFLSIAAMEALRRRGRA